MHLFQTGVEGTQRRHPLKSRSAQKTKGALSPVHALAARCPLLPTGHGPTTPHLQEDI